PGPGPGPVGGEARSAGVALRTRIGPGAAARVVAAGSAVGFLTGFFGVGGGFVIVPALVLALAFPMPQAVGTSLLVIAVNSAVALSTRVATTGVEWRVALPFTVAGVAGVSVGKRLADTLPAAKLVRWFVVLLVAVAAYTALRSALALTG
ncbi:MAG: TSUP family transporter, partial [Acidimicrobiales bacterium]